MNLNPYLKAAGPYPVVQNPCPHFSMPVNLSAPRAGCLHTTEGGSSEGADAVFKRHFAPHFVVGPNLKGQVHIEQLVPVGCIGAALEAHNDLAIVQIEAVGFSKEQSWCFEPKTLDALSYLFVEIEKQYGVPLTHPWADDDWGLAGYNTPHRRSGKFGHVAGWFSHGDIPNNCHWDCGHLQWSKIFARAQAIKAPAAAPVAQTEGATAHA